MPTVSSHLNSSPVPGWLIDLGWTDRYTVIDVIGSGGMGQVWRARDRTTGEMVAMKVIDPARAGDEHLLARLEAEADALLRLRDAGQHEHIVPILDFKITENHACLVMAFIPGQDLRTWCDMHRLDLHKRVDLLAKAARAAAWCHQHGIVHRDLKPANILVHSATGEPVVVDFSIAKTEEPLALTLTNEALGTAPYMAPEQLDRSHDPISHATDVYSLGATLYELLTHVHPHPGDLAQVIKRHQNEERPARPSLLNKEVPPDLECILLKALSHRPADRYANGIALADDLERFLDGKPVQARPMSTMIYVARQARRKPGLTTAIAACFAMGAFAAWNVNQQMAQSEVFALEDQLTAAMQKGAWEATDLAQAEVSLAALKNRNVSLANDMRQRLYDDIVHDLEAKLAQNHLRDEDFEWLNQTSGWLGARLPEQASRLRALIAERLGRWETQADLKAPFADMRGLFPAAKVAVRNNLLFPTYEEIAGPNAAITVTKSVTVPMEVSCIFLAPQDSFHSVTLVFFHESSRVSVGLYKVQDLPASVRRSLDVAEPDPQSYALALSHNSSFKRAIHIPDTHLLDQRFRFTLRVERESAEADINGKYRLRVDSSFAMGSRQASNYWRIMWPKDIGLKQLTLRTRRSDTVSPLEQADLLAMRERWAEARRLYEHLRGDPLFGDEASYKMGQCFLLEGDRHSAFATWNRLAYGPSSRWRNRSLLQLWVESVLDHDHDASAQYLDMLPEASVQSLFQQFDPWRLDNVLDAYVTVGMGFTHPRVDIATVAEATKAFRLLEVPKVQTANRFAMAHHFARLDQEARSLYKTGLSDPGGCASLPLNLMAGTNCLDQWCRIVPSERDADLMKSLALWQKTLKNNVTVQAIWGMEKARRAARGGDLRSALATVREARQTTPEQLDNRLHTSLWLLEGSIYRMLGMEDKAQLAWKKALEIASTVTMKNPLYLCDCVVLHSLTRSWDLRSAGDVLTTLAGRHLAGSERTAAQAAFNEAFLTDPAWLSVFNGSLQDESGREFAVDYALCREPPRELVQRFYRRLFEGYFLATAFPRASHEATARVRKIVDQLVTEMATNSRGEIADLYTYLHAWNDSSAAARLWEKPYPYSQAMIENMRWLLRARLGQM